MSLTKENLRNTFKTAREVEAEFVFVSIVADGTEEVIAIPRKSFDAKESFYEKAYSDELVHVMNSTVFIKDLTYGEPNELKNLI